MEDSFELKMAVVKFKKEILHTLTSAKYYFGFLKDKPAGDYVEMHFALPDYDYIARWLLSFGGNIEIVEPEELKDTLKELVKDLAGHYL